MIPANAMLIRKVEGTSDSSAGVRSDHAHGLVGVTPGLSDIFAQAQGPDDGSDNSPNVSIVAVDATNVTVKSDQASTPFTLFLFRNVDDVGRTNFTT